MILSHLNCVNKPSLSYFYLKIYLLCANMATSILFKPSFLAVIDILFFIMLLFNLIAGFQHSTATHATLNLIPFAVCSTQLGFIFYPVSLICTFTKRFTEKHSKKES